MRPLSKHIPNAITGLRIALTPLFLYFISQSGFRAAFAVFLVLCLTDISDGAAARTFGASSLFGAYLDVFADLLYVLSALAVLNLKGLAPLWFTVLTGVKFTEFAVTSHILKGVGNKGFWVFDGFGRGYGALAFLSPGVFCFAQFAPHFSDFVIHALLTAVGFCALISSAFRNAQCVRQVKRGEKRAAYPKKPA